MNDRIRGQKIAMSFENWTAFLEKTKAELEKDKQPAKDKQENIKKERDSNNARHKHR